MYESPRPSAHARRFRRGAELAVAAVLEGAGAGERWADVGSGTGHVAARLAAASLDVTGVDADPRMIEAASARFPGVRFVEGDATALPFADGDLDGVVATAVVGLLADSEAFTLETARVLRPGGRLVATFTNRTSLLWHLPRRRSPLALPARAFAADEAVAMLSAAGLTVVRLSFLDVVPGGRRLARSFLVVAQRPNR